MALTSTERLVGLRDCLLTQVDTADLEAVRAPASRPGGGFVLVGEDALTGAVELVRTEPAYPVLADRRRYAGKRRARGTARFRPSWVEAQRHLGLPLVLTDSGYVGDDDAEALDAILGQSARLGQDVLATLPLHISWVERKQNRERLVKTINEAAVPVAFVLEHERDPLGSKKTLIGFVTVLQNLDRPAMLLSCDVSALGALAFGAFTTAVGARPGLRHLYPRSGGGPADDMESAFLPDFLAFIKVGKIAQAVAADPQDPKWACACQTCQGQRVDWLLNATRSQVRNHSIELVADLRDQLSQLASGPLRQQAWRAWCASAQFQ